MVPEWFLITLSSWVGLALLWTLARLTTMAMHPLLVWARCYMRLLMLTVAMLLKCFGLLTRVCPFLVRMVLPVAPYVIVSFLVIWVIARRVNMTVLKVYCSLCCESPDCGLVVVAALRCYMRL